MSISIVRGGVPLFTRDVSLGGNQYRDALQRELNLSFIEAERLVTGESLPEVAFDRELGIMRSVTDVLLTEIHKTFDFFRATATNENIERIYVSGGAARIHLLLDYLRESFAIPVEELNPFRKIDVNPVSDREEELRKLAPRLAIAVGLALRSKT